MCTHANVRSQHDCSKSGGRPPCSGGLGTPALVSVVVSARRHSHAMAHAWELELKSWYNDMQDAGGDEETEDEAEHDPEKMTAEEALAELGDMLIDFKMQGTLHATEVCVLCFWASKAGLGGIVSRLAKAPGGSSGSYAKHFNRTIGADLNDDDSLYALDVPSFKRGHMVRSSQEIAMYPPHEAADEEINNTPNMPELLAQSVERNELPQSYFNHHITREAPHGTPVYPFALYTDAVKFQRTDSVLGVWLVSLLTNSRHLVAALRKSEMCACGCRGACTVFGLMVALHWSISCMARGRWPAARHDGAAWRASDHMRAASGGNALGWVGVILFIKCDMMEFVTTFGFPSWKSLLSPCPLCFCTRSNWNRAAGISPLSLPWAEKEWEDYCEACEACEVWVVCDTEDLHRTIKASLAYDKRRDGNRGRCLKQNIPEVGLLKGDRLEPHLGMVDTSLFDTSAPSPTLRLLFWRRSKENLSGEGARCFHHSQVWSLQQYWSWIGCTFAPWGF